MDLKNSDDYWFNYIINEDPENIKEVLEEYYIKSEDKQIHLDVYDIDRSKDRSIIFIHGTSVYSKFYAEFCYNLFKRGYRVIAPDLIGHGQSGGKRGHFTMNLFSKIIYDLTSHVIESYGKNVVVMGSSLGGITSLYCAANDNRLKGAICHNAAVFNEDAYKKIINLQGILKLLAPMIPSMARIFPNLKLSVFLYLDFIKLAQSEKVLESVYFLLKDRLFTEKYSLTAFRTQMRAPLKKSTEDINVPIMIINGDKDNLFSVDYMRELYDRLTCEKKEIAIIEGASHLIFQEHIRESLNKIIPWLEKIL